MAPDNRAWIRGKMANIKKTSGIAFSEEIFLSMLICLIAKNKHLVLHTEPDAVSELKAVIEQAPSGQYYQYSNPADEYTQRSAKLRLEKSRRSIATNHSEASDYSFRPYEHNAAPSIASFKTASERDQDVASIRRGYPQHEASDYSRGGNDDSSLNPRYSESRPKSTDAMADHIINGRARKSANISLLSTDQNIPDNSSGRRIPSQLTQPPLNAGGGSSITSGKASVTPVDFTFPRRRHESLSNAAGYGGPGGEASGVTYSGRKIAQAIILDDLENASQEVYATLLEMIVTKEINDKNRYVLPDLIIIAVFGSPNIPDKIPKQLLDYFAINGTYQPLIPQLRIQPVPPRRHALFRRTDWEELSKRMKVVTVSNDMMRYIRDVIVAVRTHEAVHGGLTARAALDLEAIIKTLAAIFQTTFVTPDLLVIAAEKVFSHRLELKSTRRRKLLPASNLVLSSSSTSSLSLPSPTQPSQPSNSLGKTPMRGFQGLRNSQQPLQGNGRRGSTSSDQSSTGGASFVEFSDSDEQSSSGSIVVNNTTRDRGQGGGGHTCGQETTKGIEDEKTAADVVQDVLRAVYPPI
ncbi:hypothetical protein BGZ79_005477 [Entomortierella chlamydospora]|nr:hypothetical protein BGZ79_005477 [Entomortierella chlamydospora]